MDHDTDRDGAGWEQQQALDAEWHAFRGGDPEPPPWPPSPEPSGYRYDDHGDPFF